MRYLFALVWLAVATNSAAQVVNRPADAPIVTAENEGWYQRGEPLQFAGDVYHLAGPTTFFNGNTMVRTGHYNGVPLYADTTIEPYSIVYVPVGRGLMQPYERVRRGEIAGTTGSRPPAFPVRAVPERGALPVAAVSPTGLPAPIGSIAAFTPEPATPQPVGTTGRVTPPRQTVTPGAVGTSGMIAAPPRRVSIGAPPVGNDGIWVEFHGQRWVSAGPAVPLNQTGFVRVGERAGFPVYTKAGFDEDVIYMPAARGYVTPYRLKPAR